MHARLRVPSQEKMQAPQFKNSAEELEFHTNRFYAKLDFDNKEAFEKLYSSSGSSRNFPVVPDHLWEESESSLGSWMFGDPSLLGFKSFLVSKFQRMSPELAAKVAPVEKFEKIALAVAVVVIAMVAKLVIDDPSKFLEVVKIVVEFGIFMAFLKLLKVAKILEFTSWKLLGTLYKLEFSQVCSGGNLNKQLSTVWSKLSFLEKRHMDDRADEMDTGRSITNFLKECSSYGKEYLQEGVRRRCQSWVESRKKNKDMADEELGPAWTKIRKMGFLHAKLAVEVDIVNAEKHNYSQEKVAQKEVLQKLKWLENNPTEKVEDY